MCYEKINSALDNFLQRPLLVASPTPLSFKTRGRGGFGMTPWCDDLVCSWRRLLADRHSLPFPWTLSLHRRWCPSASHHPLTFLFLLALTFPLPSPFPSLGLSLCRPPCPSASPHSFPSLSLGRLCQRSPRTCPVSLLCVESTQRKANAFAVGQVRPSGQGGGGGGGGWSWHKKTRPADLPMPCMQHAYPFFLPHLRHSHLKKKQHRNEKMSLHFFSSVNFFLAQIILFLCRKFFG